MPSSHVNIVTPVSGATTPLGVAIAIDYDYQQTSNGYLMVKCTHPFPGPEILLVQEVTSNSQGTGTITIPHLSGFSDVEIEARLTTSNVWGTYYVNNTVDEVTISDDPPVRITEAINDGSRVEWSFDLDVPALQVVANKKAKAKEHEYDTNADKVIDGKVKAAYKDGTLQAVVYGKKKKALNIVLLIKDIAIDPATGDWSLTIPKEVLKGGRKPRRLVVAVFDAAGEYQGSASTSLKKK